MPDKEKLITVKRLSPDIIIPSHFPQNKRKATILPKSSIKISIKGITGESHDTRIGVQEYMYIHKILISQSIIFLQYIIYNS